MVAEGYSRTAPPPALVFAIFRGRIGCLLAMRVGGIRRAYALVPGLRRGAGLAQKVGLAVHDPRSARAAAADAAGRGRGDMVCHFSSARIPPTRIVGATLIRTPDSRIRSGGVLLAAGCWR